VGDHTEKEVGTGLAVAVAAVELGQKGACRDLDVATAELQVVPPGQGGASRAHMDLEEVPYHEEDREGA
jgi:hypothetical protein